MEELNKLKLLLEEEKVILHLPLQIIDEYRRNRESKIAEALKSLREQKLNLNYPALSKDYDEYETLRYHQKEFEKNRSSLINRIYEDVANRSLKADVVIEKLFEKAEAINIPDEIISKAQFRMNIGNPPGKKGSLGDAINWEALLLNLEVGDDLYLIADDKDYFSVLEKDNPKEFLINEWNKKKNANVYFYRRLGLFFKNHFPDIKLASEYEKELAVQKLVESCSFVDTHNAISKLKDFESFTTSEVNQISDAALTNSQVNWILGDPDVFDFMVKFTAEYEDSIEDKAYKSLTMTLDQYKSEMEKDDDFPF